MPGEEGQSIVEFLIVLPILVGLSVLLIRLNTAIQVSIVNQQYARAQAHFLTYNSSVYPALRLRKDALHSNGFNQMMIGMSDQAIPEGDNAAPPEATVVQINNNRQYAGSDENQQEPEQRTKVRVRTTVTLCTQTEVVGTPAKPMIDLADGDDNYAPKGAARISEDMRYDYCRAPQGVYL